MSHESQRGDQQEVSLLAIYKAILGTVLIMIGVVIGLYVVPAVFNLLAGDDPPGIIDRFAKSAAEQLLKNAENNAQQRFDLSPDLKQIALYTLVVFALAIPASIATSLVRSGVRLMHGDAAETLARLAQRLKKSS